MKLKSPAEYGYVLGNNICLFQKGPLSQWWGGYSGQQSSFRPKSAVFADGVDECVFNCCEQFMMASKAAIMGDKETLDRIMKSKSPKKQRELGREIKNFDSVLWDRHKRHAVYSANYWKFNQNPDLKEFLFSFPRGTIFAEAASHDTIWGIGLGPEDPDALDISRWRGLNLLGEALQQVQRDLLDGISSSFSGERPI